MFLASWGMLRGSSFLLQKDYLFHNEIVKEILKKKYDDLIDIPIESMNKQHMNLIMDLKEKMKIIYHKNTYIVDGKTNQNRFPTDTLITKVLLGTLGCTPALDTYFNLGTKISGVSINTLNKQSLLKLQRFYSDNSKEIDKITNRINSQSSVNYPKMRILDMYFWQIGYNYHDN